MLHLGIFKTQRLIGDQYEDRQSSSHQNSHLGDGAGNQGGRVTLNVRFSLLAEVSGS